jgi:DNA-binding XRE family transcriptional regulator
VSVSKTDVFRAAPLPEPAGFLPPTNPPKGPNVGQKIRFYRRLNKLTEEKLAEKAELAPTYLSDVERGFVNISLDALARIAKALGIHISDLVNGV